MRVSNQTISERFRNRTVSRSHWQASRSVGRPQCHGKVNQTRFLHTARQDERHQHTAPRRASCWRKCDPGGGGGASGYEKHPEAFCPRFFFFFCRPRVFIHILQPAVPRARKENHLPPGFEGGNMFEEPKKWNRFLMASLLVGLPTRKRARKSTNKKAHRHTHARTHFRIALFSQQCNAKTRPKGKSKAAAHNKWH